MMRWGSSDHQCRVPSDRSFHRRRAVIDEHKGAGARNRWGCSPERSAEVLLGHHLAFTWGHPLTVETGRSSERFQGKGGALPKLVLAFSPG